MVPQDGGGAYVGVGDGTASSLALARNVTFSGNTAGDDSHPTPCTPHPTPCTLHPAPYTLHPKPCTLHPAPCTLHHAP